MQKFFSRYLILCFICYLPLKSMAWGMIGHRVVGQIADSYLTAKAKAEIKKILGHESIAMASNWADFIKSDSTKKYLDPWHYVNTAKGLSAQQYKNAINTDTTPNAYNRLNFLISQLKKKNLPKEEKAFYLKMLVHIAGDIAQPLHVSPEGTRGGNDVKLNWFSTPTNLHSVWDSHLIEHQQLSYTEYANAINHSSATQRFAWQRGTLSDWLYDSYVMAQDILSNVPGTNPRLGYEYNYKYLATINQQLLKGGIRLAAILNGIYK